MTISYKCPSCGANLSFNADEQAMTCGFCNARIAPEDVALSSYIHNEPQAHKDADIDDAGVEPVPLPKTRNVHISERASLYSNEEAKQYLCNNCGAKVVTDHKTASTFCMYCGSPAIISERLSGEKKADFIIPFKISKKSAQERFLAWCNGGLLTPAHFANHKNIEKMTGLYVPFWLCDVDAFLSVRGQGSKIGLTDDILMTNAFVSDYRISYDEDLSWERIPVGGASKLSDKVLVELEPFHYDDLVSFDMQYLSGFFADCPDRSVDDSQSEIYKRITEDMAKVFCDSVSDYHAVSIVAENSWAMMSNAALSLMPVWFLSDGSGYCFVMNGQTGKISGEPPLSKSRAFFLFLALLPIFVFLARVIFMGLFG
ncbi:MAG TPA: hypothetical protein GXZ67_03380 [Clostridiaceae bacterium]|nr:hypothetical protein [Clostridiaceae bacterium]